jgi:hypothetical protein
MLVYHLVAQRKNHCLYYQEEEALAHALRLMQKDGGYVVGHASRTNIKEMKKQGLPLRLLNRRLLTAYTGDHKIYKFSFKKERLH